MVHNATGDSDEEFVEKVSQKNWLSTLIYHLSMLFANVTFISWEMFIGFLIFLCHFAEKEKYDSPFEPYVFAFICRDCYIYYGRIIDASSLK